MVHTNSRSLFSRKRLYANRLLACQDGPPASEKMRVTNTARRTATSRNPQLPAPRSHTDRLGSSGFRLTNSSYFRFEFLLRNLMSSIHPFVNGLKSFR